MRTATPGPSLCQTKTLWPWRVVLLLGLIVAGASEPIAAKPTGEGRAAGRAVGGTKTKVSPRLKQRIRVRRQIVSPAELQASEYQEPFIAGDLLSPCLWTAYVVLGLVWFRTAARRKIPSTQKLALRVRRSRRSKAVRSFRRTIGQFGRAASSRPRRRASLLGPWPIKTPG